MSRQGNVVIPGLSQPIIIVDKLSKTFSDGKIKAVDNVSFEVEEGEIFGFLGPNSAGKTTTVNMLTTLLKPLIRERRGLWIRHTQTLERSTESCRRGPARIYR